MKTDSPNLDVLRSFAVVAVAASHLNTYAGADRHHVFMHNLGVGGVCFFFVHTTLVLFGSMARSGSERMALTFYIRRAFRIYPLCWVCIAVALATGLTDMPASLISRIGWRGILENVLLVQGIIGHADVLGPLWSLPLEVQMYAVLPALYLLVRRSDRLAVPFAIWGGAVGIAILALLWDRLGLHNIVVSLLFKLGMQTQAIVAPMFISGIVAFSLLGKVNARLPSLLWPIAVPAIMLLRCWALRSDTFVSVHNVLVNAAICLLVGVTIPLFRDVRTRWVTWPARQIATYSYGIYLFHVPVLVLVFGHFIQLSLAAKLALFVALTAGVSVMAYHLVEKPLIDLGRGVAGRVDAQEVDAQEVSTTAAW